MSPYIDEMYELNTIRSPKTVSTKWIFPNQQKNAEKKNIIVPKRQHAHDLEGIMSQERK